MSHRGRKNADEALLTALACGTTVENAARAAGINVRTAHRRLKDPEFKKRLHQLRAETVQRVSGALTAASCEAVQTLVALQKENNPAGVRLGAARAVLELGMKVREMAELEVQMEELQQQVTELEKNQRGAKS